MKITKTRLKQIIKEELENVVGEATDDDARIQSEAITKLVKSHAQKAINMIDTGVAKDDDPEHLKVLREVFENILEYDKNEMVDYLNDWAKHIKTARLRQQVTSIALIFQHS